MKSIVYVEDDAGSRKVMAGLIALLPQPVQLTMLENSSDFLVQVDGIQPTPDLFLLDIHITPQDGFALLRQLRAHPVYKDKIVVAITASVMNEEVNRLKAARFDGVLAKPLNFQQFPDLMARIFAGERLWAVIR